MTVQVREAASDLDPQVWLQGMGQFLPERELERLGQALAIAVDAYAGRLHGDGEPLLAHCREVASILARLRLDADTLAAGLLSALPTPAALRQHESPLAQAGALVDGVARMGHIQALRVRVEGGSPPEARAAQLESLRKMLLAMVQDVRVVLIKLADQTQTLRYLAGHGDEAARRAAARDTFDLFAPLANRLGVWQLKWELEDLALRCASPETYRTIARGLDEKRGDREAFIAEVTARLSEELARAGVRCQVSGRPKHIYSIYRKMERKGRSLDELSDIRGVRVLVDDVKDCYSALGVVHNLWTPLPGEFDDYIAKPKPNDYRSLHTAVVGPDGKVLEVQIRTYKMHQQCEYGVAAHWRYKEGARAGGTTRRGEAHFEQRVAQVNEKLAWLRQILDWRDDLAGVADLAAWFRTELAEDTVYVLTPQGRVIDLPRGATPVDFAYHVHSELGHRCRGARVDGEMVPLDHALENGQTVEIVAAKTGGPSRDWLNPELGFIHSARARAKVRQWFNAQNLEQSIAHGRALVDKALQRAGMTAVSLDRLAQLLGLQKPDELLLAVDRGEVSPRQIVAALNEATAPAPQPAAPAAPPAPVATPARGSGEILIVGVDKLLTVLAKCCKPAPPDPITGFVTRGRGVTVHRRDCANLAQMDAQRLIAAQWGPDAARGSFPVDVDVGGASEPALLRELLDLFAREKVRVAASRTQVREPQAHLSFTLLIGDLERLDQLLRLVRSLPGVYHVRRR
jgi:GTP pyrophosphokinase